MNNKLTLEQKLQLLTGHDVWNMHNFEGTLPELSMADGPHGCRSYYSRDTWDGEIAPSHGYPSLAALATSWNLDAATDAADGMSDDFIEQNRDVCLAPGVNLKRMPTAGRNFEYFSEDPVLAGKMGASFIDGLHQRGIGSCLKHFVANNSEYDRTHVSSNIDDATLMNAYAKNFRIALTAKPWMVMCSYNRVNGVYASENKKLLDGVLRKKLGFDGVIVSDWMACQNRAKALKATLDLAMPPQGDEAENLRLALERGFITEADVDASVNRLLALIERNEQAKALRKVKRTHAERHDLCRKVAAECLVLLKNDGILPLKKATSIAVLGDFAESPAINGGGAAFVQPYYKQECLSTLLKKEFPDAEITLRGGYNANTERHEISGNGIIAARRAAENADVAIVVVGTGIMIEYEGKDRSSIRLPKLEEDLIRHVSAVCDNTIVVLEAGSAIDVSPWIDGVSALLYVPFVGEATNEVVADAIVGKLNPSGKLAETFPLDLSDCTRTPDDDVVLGDDYYEGEFIGYRHFDRYGMDVAYPFGYGMSYSTFDYSNLAVKQLGETDFEISFDLTNTSCVDGAEVSQIYVKSPTCLMERPVRGLVDFAKTFVPAGQTVRITRTLSRDAFEYYLQPLEDYYVENGTYTIEVAASSRDVRLNKKVKIELDPDTQFSTTMRPDWE